MIAIIQSEKSIKYKFHVFYELKQFLLDTCYIK